MISSMEVITTNQKPISQKPISQNSLISECLKVLGFPANPIGKTAELEFCTEGTGLDTVMGTFRSFQTFQNFMGQIIEATAQPDIRADGTIHNSVVLTLCVTKVIGWPQTSVGAWRANWHFKFAGTKFNKLEAIGEVSIEDAVTSFDIMENKCRIIFKILE